MKHLTTFVVVATLSACCKKAPAPVAPQPQPDPVAVAEPPPPPPDPEAEKAKAEAERLAKEKAEAEAKAAEEKRRQAEAMAKMYAEFEAEKAQEAARWTAELKTAAKQLVTKAYPNPKAALTAIVKSPVRVPGHADRDAHRHPVETLTFFGIKQNMTVIEMGAGEGWYTEILGAFLAKAGKFFVVSPDPNGPPESFRTFYGKRTQAILDKSPELFATTKTVIVAPPDNMSLGPAGSADMVIAIREMHNWHRRKMIPAYLASIHAVLKPGGVLGVVAHRAAAGGNPDETADKGYLPEQWLIDTITAAGFKLTQKSEINANAKDTKDYPKGVWTLPPNYAEGETDKEKYKAIGESDRMTLRFVKVAAPAAPAAAPKQ